MKSNKNKPFRLRFFWPFSIFLGILFFLLVFFTSANDDIESTEEHLADTVNYLKKQCSTYSNLNLASETKSLMRIIECCQQAAHNISTDNRLPLNCTVSPICATSSPIFTPFNSACPSLSRYMNLIVL